METTVYCHACRRNVQRKNIGAMKVLPQSGKKKYLCFACLNGPAMIPVPPSRAASRSAKVAKIALSAETIKRRKAAAAAERRVARGYPKYPDIVAAAWGRG